MHHPDLHYRLSRERQLELERRAEKERALLLLRPSLRESLARALVRLAERLEPAPRPERSLNSR